MEWKGFAKVWLWLCFVCNIITLLANLGLLGAGRLSNNVGFILVASSALQIAGLVQLLFKQKKVGFYMVCAAAALALIGNIIMGNLVMGLIGAVGGIAILYAAIHSYWDMLG